MAGCVIGLFNVHKLQSENVRKRRKLAERVLITEYIKKFIDNDTKWKEDYTPVYFTIDDLEEALNFTLISEGVLLNEKSYAEGTALKVKLHSIANSSLRSYFEVENFCTINEFISDLILVSGNWGLMILSLKIIY